MNAEIPTFITTNKSLQIFCESKLHSYISTITNTPDHHQLIPTFKNLSKDCEKLGLSHLSSLSSKLASHLNNSSSPESLFQNKLSKFVSHLEDLLRDYKDYTKVFHYTKQIPSRTRISKSQELSLMVYEEEDEEQSFEKQICSRWRCNIQ